MPRLGSEGQWPLILESLLEPCCDSGDLLKAPRERISPVEPEEATQPSVPGGEWLHGALGPPGGRGAQARLLPSLG